ncbi:hypothetical protein [Streptomyces globisporus]|uniref:hypothetical protein n=1 Tax=Streptomyces globisporus TaxID=1908 RepID=UPI0037028620
MHERQAIRRTGSGPAGHVLTFQGFDHLHLEQEKEQKAAVDHQFSLILEFLEVRDAPWALTPMYAQYHHMRTSLHEGDPSQKDGPVVAPAGISRRNHRALRS